MHQNLTFPVHPDPISGCTAGTKLYGFGPPQPGDRHGDIMVDTAKSRAVYASGSLSPARRTASRRGACEGRRG